MKESRQIINKSFSSHSGLLVTGPARCGKSQLVAAIKKKGECPLSILTVDALLPYYIRSSINNKNIQCKNFFKEYLYRTRYMDPDDLTVRRPVDDIEVDESVLCEFINYPKTCSALSLIGGGLSGWAAIKGKHAWIAPELHAEIYFRKIHKEIPSLRLMVLLRDPREALAAAVYWRTYPVRIKRDKRVLLHKLLLWCLAAEVGKRYANEMPEYVSVLNLDESEKIQAIVFDKLDEFDNSINLEPESLYFSYDSEKGFLAPDNMRRQLLTDSELSLIEGITYKWYQGIIYRADSTPFVVRFRIILVCYLLEFILLLAKLNPVFAKGFVDSLLFPVKQMHKFLNRVSARSRESAPRLYAIFYNIRRLWLKP